MKNNKINKNQRWAKKQVLDWMKSWEYVGYDFDGAATVVKYKHKISFLMVNGIAHYYAGDKRSDVVAGHLADSRAKLDIIKMLIETACGYQMFYKMFWSEKNDKLDYLLLEARKLKNLLLKDIHKCQNSLNYFEQKD